MAGDAASQEYLKRMLRQTVAEFKELSNDPGNAANFARVSSALMQVCTSQNLPGTPSMDDRQIILQDDVVSRPLFTSRSSARVHWPFTQNESQRTAVSAALNHSVGLFLGPPGTGKTSTATRSIANWIASARSELIG